uniref:Reverse transcriptase domain-containing protein n=1 Tax=Cajanus cajan TaxID=3821 RepID=A0A151UAM8_CAJCA|nr:hypothetical protein KK1_020553 [Cajanus cajan]
MEKGLRKRDPIAPFLFLIVAKGLGELMREVCRKHIFEGAQVGSSNVQITVLQFVDDALFFKNPSLKIEEYFRVF